MKKILKKFGLSLAALACVACAGVGIAVGSSDSATAQAADATISDYYVSGAGIRLVNDANGTGLRFHTSISAADYSSIVESGTLIIPEVRFDGELTLDDLNNTAERRPKHIYTKNPEENLDFWYDYNGMMRSTVYLYNIPESSYGARMVAVSYVKTESGDTLYTPLDQKISISEVATIAYNSSSVTDLQKAQIAPYIVDEVTVKYNMPDGSTQTETVKYGEKLPAPEYNTNAYVVASATDQYGNEIDFANYEATLPVTIDVELATKTTVTTQWIKDRYGASREERAFVDASTATAVTEGIPNGYSSVLKLDWYSGSTAMWDLDNGNRDLYRSCFDNTDLSSYGKVTFAMMLETNSDAYIATKNGGTDLGANVWLYFELVQTSANVWTVTVTNTAGEILYKTEGLVRNSYGFSSDVDSIGTLLFCAYSTAADAPKLVVRCPSSTTDTTASIYFTEVIGYKDVPDFDTGISEDAEILWNHIWNNYYFTGGDQAEGAYAEDVTAPKGFNYVNYYSWTSPTSNDFPKTGYLNGTDISAYSDLWFAMKLVNGMDIYVQGADAYTGGDWLYVHLQQADDGTWTKTLKSPDGYTATQTNLTGYSYTVDYDNRTVTLKDETVTLVNLLNYLPTGYSGDYTGGSVGSYPRHEKGSSETATVYFTDVLATRKDGATMTPPKAPDYATDSTDFDPEIPANALSVRAYPWRDDKYTDGTMAYALASADAPAGYSNVLKHTWKDTRTTEYVYCFDDTLDITQYSDLYLATKMENGTHIYVKNGGGHYTGSNWLYVHYKQVSTGVWQASFKAADGYETTASTTISATTINALTSGNLYGHAATAGMGTITYWTEILGIPAEGTWGDRVIYSAVDGAVATKDSVGLPVGFTNLYKYTNITMDNFAAMDLTDTIYQEISFGMLANTTSVMLTDAYNDFEGYEPSNYANFRTTTSTAGAMYLINLVNNGNGSWTVTVNTKVYFDPKAAADGTDLDTQSQPSYTATVTGNSLSEIMSTFMQITDKVTTVYVTEVRGTHTCAYNNTKSLGNGYLQDYCICGETMGDPYEFAHGIPEEAQQVLDQVWRDDDYALSASTDEEIPVGYSNIVEFNWADNRNNWQETNKDMGLTCIPTNDISAYSDVYFAMKLVGGDGIYVRGAATKYKGGDWLYVHYSQANDGTWSLSLSSPDGYTAEKTGITGTNLQTMMSYTGSNNGLYPTRAVAYWKHNTDGTIVYEEPADSKNYTTVSTQAAIVYLTDLRAIVSCEHTAGVSYVSNGDGTHNEVCANCNTVLDENIACQGGNATCTEAAVCEICGVAYGSALGHQGAWVDDVYKCSVCGLEMGEVATSLAQQDVALFTNATYAETGATATGAFDANVATPATISFSGLVNGLNIDSVSNVALNGVPYVVESFENEVLTIKVVPFDVYGEYTLTATVTVEGKEFEVEIPVLVITDLITTNAGLQNLRKVLRGQDATEYTATTTISGTEYREFGGKGGTGTMNGTGYYKLGANITMTEIRIGEYHTEDYSKQLTYVFGTPTVPFTGTFDGDGYILDNYKAVKSAYNKKSSDSSETVNLVQDISACTTSSMGTTLENEASLFGYMDGVVKNVAFTNAQFGQYGNLVLTGSGVMEDVYIDIARLQATRSGSTPATETTEILVAYVAPLLQRQDSENVLMRNVVVDLQDSAFACDSETIKTHYPSLIGRGLRSAQNVAVYGFDTAWIATDGSGNVLNNEGTYCDGSDVGVYVEYRDNTTNGANFVKTIFSDELWKIVDGVPYLKNVSVSGTETKPSENVTQPEAGVEYTLIWETEAAGGYDASSFIANTTVAAIGSLGEDTVADLDNFDKKQIIVGTYADYGAYVNADRSAGGEYYGVYKESNTLFVLSDTEEGFMFAAKELCRQLYGWNQLTYLAYDPEAIVLDAVSSIDVDLVENYTTQITFNGRDPANDKGLSTLQKTDMGFTPGAPYTSFVSMHNAANFFGVSSSTDEENHADMTIVPDWSTAETSTFATTSGGALVTNSDVVQYQLCYTGHGSATTFWAMVDQVVNVVKAKKAAVPTMTVINLMVEDNTAKCACTTCSQFAPSVTQLLFLNAVQKQLKAEGVGVGIEFFAYNAYSTAPVMNTTALANMHTLVNTLNASAGEHEAIAVSTATVDYSSITAYEVSLDTTVLLAEEGLRLWWTTHEMNHSFPMEHEANAHIYPSLLAWIASVGGENIDVFAYQAAYRNYFIPLNTWEYQILYYQTLHKLGVTSYMFNLGDNHNAANAQTGFMAFKTYIDSRAQADVNVTFEKLKQEFFGYTEDASGNKTFNNRGYYGAGGKYMLTYFEELVAVYEGHKQGATNQFVDTSTNVGISTMGADTGYIATWLYNNNSLYYDSSSFDNYYTCHRQGFFNGSYGWDVVAALFGDRASSSSARTPSTDLYVYGDLTQTETLEQWYTYCENAVAAVDANSKYVTRIRLEQLVPEYLYFTYNSTYAGSSSSTAPNVTSTFTGTSTVFTRTTYQAFYEHVVSLGMTVPSEFYGFGDAGSTGCIADVKLWSTTHYYIYGNMFKNWGVTVSTAS